jgi:hypothetical protein
MLMTVPLSAQLCRRSLALPKCRECHHTGKSLVCGPLGCRLCRMASAEWPLQNGLCRRVGSAGPWTSRRRHFSFRSILSIEHSFISCRKLYNLWIAHCNFFKRRNFTFLHVATLSCIPPSSLTAWGDVNLMLLATAIVCWKSLLYLYKHGLANPLAASNK